MTFQTITTENNTFSPAERAELVASVTGLIYKEARRYASAIRDSKVTDIDDLVQAANLMVWEKIYQWNPSRGAFTTWSHGWIRNAVQREYQRMTWQRDWSGDKKLVPGRVQVSVSRDASGEVIELEGVSENGYAAIEDASSIDNLLAVLTDREREIVLRRVVEDETLETVGDTIGLSRERVRQIERSAIRKVKAAYHAAEDQTKEENT